MRLIIMLLLLCVPSHAYEPLEQLVQITPDQLLEMKITRVLKKHKVVRPEYYANLIAHSKYTVKEKKLAVAILVPESRGVATATSCKGAQGPWQVMPGWKKKLKIKGSLYHPPTCLDAAIRVWNIHLKDAKGSERKALVAYSGNAKGYPDKVFNILQALA